MPYCITCSCWFLALVDGRCPDCRRMLGLVEVDEDSVEVDDASDG